MAIYMRIDFYIPFLPITLNVLWLHINEKEYIDFHSTIYPSNLIVCPLHWIHFVHRNEFPLENMENGSRGNWSRADLWLNLSQWFSVDASFFYFLDSEYWLYFIFFVSLSIWILFTVSISMWNKKKRDFFISLTI